jgi:proline racemase
MKFSRVIECIDAHTVGEATRITVAGAPFFKGSTVMEQKQDMAANHDWLRKVLIFEPRGHLDMFGAILVKPNHPEADFGVIFTDSGGYLNMCGHGSIGVSTALVETGYIKMKEPYTTLNLEAPAGLIRVKVKVSSCQVESVTLTNVPAFVYKKGCEINLPGAGKVKFDISFGGSFFAIVHASELKLEIRPQNLGKLVPLALHMREIINREIKVQHPLLPINKVDLVEIYDKPESKGANAKNVVIFGNGNVDRSPCGTGTSAKLALLHSEGKIGLNEPFVYESILNTKFTGLITEETKVGEFKAVVPQITGSAYITGFNKFVIDEHDPLKDGFLLQGR